MRELSRQAWSAHSDWLALRGKTAQFVAAVRGSLARQTSLGNGRVLGCRVGRSKGFVHRLRAHLRKLLVSQVSSDGCGGLLLVSSSEKVY